ncbi:MAG: alpha/beta fold hydrolase [Candidatus Dormibacteraceae bacterium]
MSAFKVSVIEPQPYLEEVGEGPPVLLLHGWRTSSQLWLPIINHLKANFSVLAPDFPSFGQTPPPPAVWGVEQYARWIIDLLDSKGLSKVHVVGHSFGGRVAIKLAARWPQRVEKLVLTSSSGIRPARSPVYRFRVASFKTLRSVANARYIPASLRRWAQARVASSGSDDYRQATGIMRPTFVRIVNEDQRPDLGQIAAPTLLIWGERDDETPLRDGREMERLVPNAGLVVFSAATHYAYLEQSARFCRVLDAFFLAGQA